MKLEHFGMAEPGDCRERLDFEDVPKAFKGIPIALITAGILAMAFMGFSGLV